MRLWKRRPRSKEKEVKEIKNTEDIPVEEAPMNSATSSAPEPPQAYGVMTMRVNPLANPEAYKNTLSFWKTVEEKYQERKRLWMEANARMIAAKLAAMRARKQMEDARKELNLSNSVAEEGNEEEQEEFGETKYDEFSDIEPDMFKDPADRYYSSLDATMWENIRNDIMNIHRRAEDAPAERRRMVLRGVILSAFLFMWILVGVVYLVQKVDQPAPVPVYHVRDGTGCHMNCSGSSIISDILQSVFPAGSDDDEI